MSKSIIALVTPFLNYDVDFLSLDNLLKFHIENNTTDLLLLGTTGESSTLSDDEKYNIIKFCIERLPDHINLIVGVCLNDTMKIIRDCLLYETLGISSFLIPPPYYNKTSEDGIYNHYLTIANSIKGNIIIYNIPGRTGVQLKYDIIKELSQIENITGIKDSTDNFKETIKLFELQSNKFKIYCGNDELMIPFLSLGCDGVINVTGNILPNEVNLLCTNYEKNSHLESLNNFNKIKPLILEIFNHNNPIGIKEAMSIVKLISKDIRLPLMNLALTKREKIIDVLYNG